MDTGNTAWLLASSALVLLMTPGLAFFYGGMVRGKNVLTMLMQNFICIGIVSVVWVLVGYTLAFGRDGFGGHGIAGNFHQFGLAHMQEAVAGYAGPLAQSIPPVVFVAFQLMFAVITPALITGSIADRTKFGAFCVFVTLWSVLVYSLVAHWVFSPEGWLFKRGAEDFAGGTVVHINAGIAGLALAAVIGKRVGWPKEQMKPHNLPFTLLGAGLLWFGWFGFNAGSALGANQLAGYAFVNTNTATAAAMLAWLVVEKLRDGHATTLGAASGAVAGLVAITPAAGFVSPLGSIAIGIIAGVGCSLAVTLKFKFGLDDSLDVVGVHLVGGILGSLAVGLFGTKTIAGLDGVFYGGGWHLFKEQAIAVGAVIVFSGVMSLILGKLIDLTIGLRVSTEDEITGLDQTIHAESAYETAAFAGGGAGSLTNQRTAPSASTVVT
ncbi:MAG: amtB [Frankiales bacterium]|nr:amtB [Frankiales bacterium]